MGYINSLDKPNITTGDITVEPTAFTSRQVDKVIVEQTGGANIDIPGDQRYVLIQNQGVENGGTPNKISVDGQLISVGRQFEFKKGEDKTTSEEVLSDPITVSPNGAHVFILYYK